jgi:mannose-6-phosphate isomerase
MSPTPALTPLRFSPIYMPKPWGGRRLAERFGKDLPADGPIGESWELVSLDNAESVVRDGPHAGKTLSRLIDEWGPDLLGGASLADGRFPLLIKFLDARENLSVQVHPRPAADGQWRPGVKHEAWYVIDADPGANIYIGLKPGVTPNDVALSANTPAMADLLRTWPAKPGLCYYLPSGTMHALGAGVLVAEVQTPSDTTYRIYDWDRVDEQGRSRDLHIDQALANLLAEVPDSQIRQPRRHTATVLTTASRLTMCEKFTIEKIRMVEGARDPVACGEMQIWIVLAGRGRLEFAPSALEFAPGDTILIPAGLTEITVAIEQDAQWLDVRIPLASDYAGLPHPPREARAPADGPISLTRNGKRIPRTDLHRES